MDTVGHQTNGIELNIDTVIHATYSVATSHYDGNRHTCIPAHRQNLSVTRLKSALGQRHAAETIPFKSICTGKIDRQFRLRCGKIVVQSLRERFEVVAVARSVRQSDIEITLGFGKRKFLLAMH
jgi:hypothetical protein